MPPQAAAEERNKRSGSHNHPARSSPVAAAENPTEEELSPEFLDALTRWLVYRQTKTIPEEDFEVREGDFPSPIVIAKPGRVSHSWESRGGGADGGESRGEAAPPVFYVQGASTELGIVTDSVLPPLGSQPQIVAPPPIDPAQHELNCAGFNGRCNKVSDTCYGFWVGGALAVRLFPPTLFSSFSIALTIFFILFFIYVKIKPLFWTPRAAHLKGKLGFTLFLDYA